MCRIFAATTTTVSVRCKVRCRRFGCCERILTSRAARDSPACVLGRDEQQAEDRPVDLELSAHDVEVRGADTLAGEPAAEIRLRSVHVRSHARLSAIAGVHPVAVLGESVCDRSARHIVSIRDAHDVRLDLRITFHVIV